MNIYNSPRKHFRCFDFSAMCSGGLGEAWGYDGDIFRRFRGEHVRNIWGAIEVVLARLLKVKQLT